MDSTGSGPDVRKERQLAMLLHFSVFAGLVVPLLGLIAPIVLWQLKKDEFPALNAHAYSVFNWMISAVLYFAVAVVLCMVLIGIPLLFALSAVAIAFPIVGGIKANQGEVWRYPLTIPFFR